MEEVTDPDILKRLNSPDTSEVTDPDILARLNGSEPELSTGEKFVNKASRVGLGFSQPFIGAAQGLSHLTGIGKETTQSMVDWEAQHEKDLKEESRSI